MFDENDRHNHPISGKSNHPFGLILHWPESPMRNIEQFHSTNLLQRQRYPVYFITRALHIEVYRYRLTNISNSSFEHDTGHIKCRATDPILLIRLNDLVYFVVTEHDNYHWIAIHLRMSEEKTLLKPDRAYLKFFYRIDSYLTEYSLLNIWSSSLFDKHTLPSHN
jgi:hypothetical protein